MPDDSLADLPAPQWDFIEKKPHTARRGKSRAAAWLLFCLAGIAGSVAGIATSGGFWFWWNVAMLTGYSVAAGLWTALTALGAVPDA